MGTSHSTPNKKSGVVIKRKRSIKNVPTVESTDVCDKRFEEKYFYGYKVLGKGGDAIVYEGVETISMTKVAVKVKEITSPKDVGLQSECRILSDLDHRGIVKLVDSHIDNNRHIMVLELAQAGDLIDKICEQKLFEEDTAKGIIVNLAEAIRYLHSKNVVHRDIKPENILLRSCTSYKNLMLADFGFAAICQGDSLTERLGTFKYMAPELFRATSYGKAVDVWALGVTMYVLLSGRYPFYHQDSKIICRLILQADIKFESEVWSLVSDDAKDLLRKIFVADPKQRCTIDEVLLHPWILSFVEVFDDIDIEDVAVRIVNSSDLADDMMRMSV
jgi:serine/threonine protein kinase